MVLTYPSGAPAGAASGRPYRGNKPLRRRARPSGRRRAQLACAATARHSPNGRLLWKPAGGFAAEGQDGLVAGGCGVELREGGVVDKQADNVRGAQGRVERREFHADLQQVVGQRADVGLDDEYAARLLSRRCVDDLYCRALPGVVDVRLERQAEQSDGRMPPGPREKVASRGRQRRGHALGTGVVHLPGGPDQRRRLRRGLDDEPGIDGDAVAAHADARPQHIHPRMPVGQPDDLPDVGADVIAHVRQLVGEGEVPIAEGVLGELAELGRSGVRTQHVAAHEQLVERHGALGAGGAEGRRRRGRSTPAPRSPCPE